MRKTKDLFEFKNIPLNVHTKLLICPFFVMISSHSLISLINRLSKASESQTLNY